MKDLMALDKEDHVKFLSHLDASHPAVRIVATYLVSRGHRVVVNPTTKAKTHGEWKDHADNGDITMWANGEGKPLRVEVKRLSKAFTRCEDWPFPDMIVCAKHSFDRANPPVNAYIYLNADMTHGAIVQASTRPHWTVKKLKDTRYAIVEQDFYMVELNHATFIKTGNKEVL